MLLSEKQAGVVALRFQQDDAGNPRAQSIFFFAPFSAPRILPGPAPGWLGMVQFGGGALLVESMGVVRFWGELGGRAVPGGRFRSGVVRGWQGSGGLRDFLGTGKA
jgi:hypothetical protein